MIFTVTTTRIRPLFTYYFKVICIALALPVFGLKAQTCGSTWLNVTNYNGGVTIGDLDITGDKITIEAKFNRSIPYTRGRLYAGDLVSKHTDPINTNYLLRPNSAEITTENGYFVTLPVCEIEINKTYHVALVYDGTTLKFYRNGFLMSRVSASGALVQNNLLTTIGDLAYLPGYAQESLVGYIDEVKIWGVARSQSQIRAYMNQALPNPSAQAGLLAYYTFNDLKNKQGNTLWDARIFGNANLQSTNPTCATYASDSCSFVVTVPNSVEADFSVPDSVCINEPININNLTKGGTNFYWNFCVADINQTPVGENLGNLGGELSQPVFMDFAKDDNGDYYGFSINHIPGQLIRYRFGNSLLNTPVVENLGNYNGDIPNQAEGVQIVKANGKWYIVVVGGGNGLPNSSPRVVVIDFGSSMGSVSQISHNWGNLGLLDQPIDLHVFNEGNNWYGFTVNALNNTITRFDFSNNFDVAPTAINLGDFGLLNYPDGIYAVNDNNFWRVFITNGLGNTITRLDFGSSLLNTPVPVDLGNPGNTLITPRDMLVVKFCDSYTGFIVNANTDEIIKLDFGSGFDQIPTAKSLGNIANFDKPHSLSKLFRVNQDIYSFITNADNNAITRLKFSGCTNSNTPNSADSLPPPITYNAPGIYNINLMVDEGLPTQTSVCKTVVVKDCIVENAIVADFDVPDSICVNVPININNLTKGGTNFYWNFNVADITSTPTGENLGNPGDNFRLPVFTDVVEDNGNYYVFVVNNYPGGLVRLDFGNSLLNVPTSVNLGNIGGVIANNAEGIQVIKSNNKWYAIIVGGYPPGGVPSRIMKIALGTNIANNTPTGVDWGNIGNLNYPIDLHVFQENGNWYGFTVNFGNNTITRFDFGNDFDIAPTAMNLGNVGDLNGPTGVYAISDNGNWSVFVANDDLNNSSISRLDFGSSLLNNPIGVNLGNIDNKLFKARDIYVVKFCDQLTGFVVNNNSSTPDDIVRLDFTNGLLAKPAAVSLGNIGSLNFPHSFSQIFRVGQDLFSFITNVDDNSISRIKLSGSNNSNTPNSADSLPPPVTYNAPGIYNINLMVNEGLPTQTSLCKSITVVPSPAKLPIFDTAFCSSDSIVLSTTFPAPYTWNTAAQNDSITIKQAGIYWVETNYYGCVVRDSINVINAVSPAVNLGADTAICRLDSLLINAGNAGASFLWNTGSTSQSILADSAGTYIVHVKNSGGCTSSDTLVLANHAAIALKVTSDTTLCTGSSLMLQANGNNVQTYAWLPDNTLTDISISNPVASPNDTTRYYVSATDIYGCIESDSVLINVAALPSVAAMADTGICAGSSIILANSATQGVKYLWSPSGGLSSGVDPSPIATPAANTTYTVTVTTGAGCTATDSVVIAVNPLPAVTASTSDTLICVGSIAVVSATSPGVVSYNWFPPSDLANPLSPVTVASPKTNTNYVVEVTDNNGCKIKDSVQVSVKPLPVFAVTPSTSGVCKGESVTLTALGGDEYAWSPTAGLTVFDKPVVVATPEVSTKYQAIITDNICNMADTLFAVVNITSLSNITVTKSNDIDCIIGTTNLRATGGLVYNWSPGTYLSDSTIATPVAAPLQTTTYHVKVSNTLGCTGSDSVTVNVYKGRVENGYKMPGAFTPNGDGNNDCFNVRKWGTLTGLDFSVYDRWGKLIFHTNNASDCWDGTYKGQLQPPGAYVYQVRAQALCGTVYRKGTVVLIR